MMMVNGQWSRPDQIKLSFPDKDRPLSIFRLPPSSTFCVSDSFRSKNDKARKKET
jgi:hypothetical protein